MLCVAKEEITQRQIDRRVQNSKLLLSKMDRYPFWFATPPFRETRTHRPERFQREHPDIMFLCAPVLDMRIWAFETEADRDVFRAWDGKSIE